MNNQRQFYLLITGTKEGGMPFLHYQDFGKNDKWGSVPEWDMAIFISVVAKTIDEVALPLFGDFFWGFTKLLNKTFGKVRRAGETNLESNVRYPTGPLFQ